MMLKLERGSVNLKPAKPGYVDRVVQSYTIGGSQYLI